MDLSRTINLTLNVTPEMFELLKPLLALASEVQPCKEPEFISIKEAADRCPYSYKTVYGWIVYKKQISCTQPGGRNGKRIVRREDFDRLISEKLSGAYSLPRTSTRKNQKEASGRRTGRPRKEPPAFV